MRVILKGTVSELISKLVACDHDAPIALELQSGTVTLYCGDDEIELQISE